jgi:ribosomal protein L11 methyltransferase
MRFGISEVSVEDSADLQTIMDAKDWLGWDYVAEELTEAAGAKDDPSMNEAVVTFYTEDTDDGRSRLTEIKTALLSLKGEEQYGSYGSDVDFGRLYAESEPLTDEWKEIWKESFHMFRASERIVVKPSWDDGQSDSQVGRDDVVITIDPGMAFGTGTHETTAMCLAELDRTIGAGMSVIDIGAGSGILSIAAAKLGAGRVTAVEYDGDAADVAAVNIESNGVSGSVELVKGDVRNLTRELGEYDIVIANLTSGLIRQIADTLSAFTKHGGKLIISGLLDHEEQEMKTVLEGAGFTVSSPIVRGEWLLLCADFS